MAKTFWIAFAAVCWLAGTAPVSAQAPAMPDFTTTPTPYQSAQEQLRRLHRIAQPKFGPSKLAKGLVYAQDPKAGDSLAGRRPTLFVSDGTLPPESTSSTTSVVNVPAGVTANADVGARAVLDSGEPPFVAGQVLKYRLLVSNYGPDVATAVTTTVTPTNLTLFNVSGDCTELPCTIADKASGVATINFDAKINSAGTFSFEVASRSVEHDDDLENNVWRSAAQEARVARADVEVSVQIEAQPKYVVGDDVRFTVHLLNHGPDLATAVRSKLILTNLSLEGVSERCDPTECVTSSLEGEHTFNIRARIVAEGPFELAVESRAGERDADPDNNVGRSGSKIAGPAPPGWKKWLQARWPWLAGGATLLALLAALALRPRKTPRWAEKLEFQATADRKSEWTNSLIEKAKPLSSLHARVENRKAQPDGPVPVEKSEVIHD